MAGKNIFGFKKIFVNKNAIKSEKIGGRGHFFLNGLKVALKFSKVALNHFLNLASLLCKTSTIT